MARKATIQEVYLAYIASTQDATDSAFNLFEDRLRIFSAARHMRRLRSDSTRSVDARRAVVQRHAARRAKQFMA